MQNCRLHTTHEVSSEKLVCVRGRVAPYAGKSCKLQCIVPDIDIYSDKLNLHLLCAIAIMMLDFAAQLYF